MADDRREIALKALRAAGHDRAADIVAALIPEGGAESAAAPALGAPASDAVPAQVQELAAEAAARAVPGSPPGAPLTMDTIAGMSEQQINARWDEVQSVLAGGK